MSALKCLVRFVMILLAPRPVGPHTEQDGCVQVDTDRLEHSYGSRSALRGVSIHIDQGVTGLVGVNGAGKSTLLHIMSGALRPSAGAVLCDGVELYSRARRQLLPRIGLMPQSFEFPGEVRVRELVSYITWMRGSRWRDSWLRAGEALEIVGLASRSQSAMRTLSGGMVRRVALAQALAARPDVLLLDEPTTGLDPEQRVAVRNMIAGLPNIATVISSHVLEDVEQVSDRLVILDEGRIAYTGTVTELADEYQAANTEEAFLALLRERRRVLT